MDEGRLQVQAPEEWVPCDLVGAFGLSCTAEYVAQRLGATWLEEYEPGLGPTAVIMLARDGESRYALVASGLDYIHDVMVEARRELDPWTVQWEVLGALGLTTADIAERGWYASWSLPAHTPARQDGAEWRLWRQDDHGNVVAIRDFVTRDGAERARRMFTARGHGQIYWVAPRALDA